jgi:hypothetical protein
VIADNYHYEREKIAPGIVADSPEAEEPASLPRTMSGKPDGELASRGALAELLIIRKVEIDFLFRRQQRGDIKFLKQVYNIYDSLKKIGNVI